MSQNFKINEIDDEIDLREIFNILWNGKFVIAIICFFSTICSIFYAYQQPKVYESKSTLMVVSDPYVAGFEKSEYSRSESAQIASIFLQSKQLPHG